MTGSDDLVERLLAEFPWSANAPLCLEAADRIAELEAERDRYRKAIDRHKAQQDRYWESTTHWDRELYDALTGVPS